MTQGMELAGQWLADWEAGWSLANWGTGLKTEEAEEAGW